MKAAGVTPELPRVYLNTSYVAPTGRVIAVTAGGDFQAALNSAQPGDVITLQAGVTFTGNFTLPNKSWNGQGSPWIIIRSSTADTNLPPAGTRITPSYSAVLPKLITNNTFPVLTTQSGAHHYRFMGVEFGMTSSANWLVNLIDLGSETSSMSNFPNHLIFDRSYIHGNRNDNLRRGIAMNSASTSVIDSYVSDVHQMGGDSQAICGWGGPGPFKIVNSYLEGSGENVMFGGASPWVSGLIPSDIEFRNNTAYKPLSWRIGHPTYAGNPWTVKNLFELKNAQRVLIDGNTFENNWMHAQVGFAIVFTPRNDEGNAPWSLVQDLTFTNNKVLHSGSAINLLGTDDIKPSGVQRRVLIKNNLFEDIDGAKWGGSGRFIQVIYGVENLTVDHNTAFQTGTIVMADQSGRPNTGFVYTNNITSHGDYGIFGSGSTPGNISLATYFPGAVVQKNVIVGGSANNYPTNNFFLSSIGQVGFVNPGGGDYRLATSSPYCMAGTDGKDIGCQMGQSPPTTNPPPPPPVISGVSATGVTQNSASILWATSALSDSQVEYGATTAYGSQTSVNATLITNHLVTLTSLSPGVTYNYRVRSRDAAGNLAVSANSSFTTAAAAVPPAPVDITPPVISAVTAIPNGPSSATIQWTTNEASDSQVEYGSTMAYGKSTALDVARVTIHSAVITGLSANTLYNHRVKSRDAAGNLAVSGNLTFLTGGPVGGGDVITDNIPVLWTQLIDLTLVSATLRKTAGCEGCEATAVSQQTLTSGNGFVQFTATENSKDRWVGLMAGGGKASRPGLKYAIHLAGPGIAEIRENKLYRTEVGYKTGDVFRIAIENGVVRYYKNGAIMYQSKLPPAYPMAAAVVIPQLQGTVANVVLGTGTTAPLVAAASAPARTTSTTGRLSARK